MSGEDFQRRDAEGAEGRGEDRPDLELIELVGGTKRPGCATAIPDDVVRGAVELIGELREHVEALVGQLKEEEAEVKRLRAEVLGSPKWWVDTVPVGDRERPRLMTYRPTGSQGYYAVLVRLSPDGLELATREHMEGAGDEDKAGGTPAVRKGGA